MSNPLKTLVVASGCLITASLGHSQAPTPYTLSFDLPTACTPFLHCQGDGKISLTEDGQYRFLLKNCNCVGEGREFRWLETARICNMPGNDWVYNLKLIEKGGGMTLRIMFIARYEDGELHAHHSLAECK